jgi:hypothetical protein
MTIALRLYDRARASIAARGLDADVQTRIALFVGAAKSVNAAIMAGFALQPQVTAAYPFVHGQYFRELEFVSLLTRVTRWSANGAIYAESAPIIAPLWAEWWRVQLLDPPGHGASTVYGSLALGHALLARVRLAPVIGDDADELDPFVVALRRIEQEGGRMIQAQIRLLKEGASSLGVTQRERILEAKQEAVDAAFRAFLEWLVASADGTDREVIVPLVAADARPPEDAGSPGMGVPTIVSLRRR